MNVFFAECVHAPFALLREKQENDIVSDATTMKVIVVVVEAPTSQNPPL